jgi:hypothetical protein
MGSPLHRARAGEQRLSERVADGAETKLVTRLRLSEKLDDLQLIDLVPLAVWTRLYAWRRSVCGLGVGASGERCGRGSRPLAQRPQRASGVSERLRGLPDELPERAEHAVRYTLGVEQALLHLVVVAGDLVLAIAHTESRGEALDERCSPRSTTPPTASHSSARSGRAPSPSATRSS